MKENVNKNKNSYRDDDEEEGERKELSNGNDDHYPNEKDKNDCDNINRRTKDDHNDNTCNFKDAADIITPKPQLTTTIRDRAAGVKSQKVKKCIAIQVSPVNLVECNATQESSVVEYDITRTTTIVDVMYKTDSQTCAV